LGTDAWSPHRAISISAIFGNSGDVGNLFLNLPVPTIQRAIMASGAARE
jgi:hypothetical protein